MKTKLTMMVAMAAACAAIQLTAMPTEEEAKQAGPVVRKLLASERAALSSGSKTRSQVAAAAMELAGKEKSEAVKLLLMKGAFTLYLHDGDLQKAVDTMKALKAAIPDIPPQNVSNMIKTALDGWSNRVDGARLYGLLDEQEQATVDGYTWSYRVRNGEATIVSEKGGKYSCAVSPMPTGDVKIPTTLNGIKVTRIGRAAFRLCKKLTSATIPEGVTLIDVHAFDLCDGLKSVTLPSSLKVIGPAAFGKCVGLTSVEIPDGVNSIWDDAFNGCGLKSVVIPKNVTRIGERAFCGCNELESVSIPEKVAAIGEGAFGCGSKLKQIDLAAGNQSFALVDGVLYKKDLSVLLACPGAKTSVTIPEGVTKIGAFAFRNCSGLKSVTIPEGVTKIEWVAFVYCKGLTSVTIPKSVKAFGPEAFKECVELASVTMLGECPKAQNDIFRKCGKLKAIHVPANAKSWSGMKDWQGIPLVFDAK